MSIIWGHMWVPITILHLSAADIHTACRRRQAGTIYFKMTAPSTSTSLTAISALCILVAISLAAGDNGVGWMDVGSSAPQHYNGDVCLTGPNLVLSQIQNVSDMRTSDSILRRVCAESSKMRAGHLLRGKSGQCRLLRLRTTFRQLSQ